MTTAYAPAGDCGCDDDEFAAVTADDETATADADDPRGRKVTRWRSLIAPIGKPTGDGRSFAADALTNRELPIALKWQRADGQGHGGSTVIGTMDKAEYSKDGVWGEGILFDPDPAQLPRLAEDVNEFKMLARSGTVGPSVDLDDMEFTVMQPEGEMSAKPDPEQPQKRPKVKVTKGRISAVTMVPIAAFAETAPTFQTFEVDLDEATADDRPAVTAAGVRTFGWQDLARADRPWDALEAVERVAAWADGDDEAYGLAFLYDDGARRLFPVADVVDGRLTVVDDALFAATDVLEAGQTDLPESTRDALLETLARLRGTTFAADEELFPASAYAAVVASSATIDVDTLPPLEWFHDPDLDGPTPITVTPDGRVFGHLATWGTCHTGIQGACTTPPKSRTDYAYFHTGEVLTEEGSVSVGRVSLGGGHADTRLGFRAAAEHYDSTSTCVATVRAGQDKHGIWIAGSTVPGLDAYKIAELRRSPLSGDWRRVGGNLELVHALAVNSGGFPVPRASMVASGLPGEQVQNALVAAGVLQVDEVAEQAPERVDLAETISSAVAAGIAEYTTRQRQASSLLSLIESEFSASGEARARKQALDLLKAF